MSRYIDILCALLIIGGLMLAVATDHDYLGLGCALIGFLWFIASVFIEKHAAVEKSQNEQAEDAGEAKP